MNSGMIWIAVFTVVMVGLGLVQFMANRKKRRKLEGTPEAVSGASLQRLHGDYKN